MANIVWDNEPPKQPSIVWDKPIEPVKNIVWDNPVVEQPIDRSAPVIEPDLTMAQKFTTYFPDFSQPAAQGPTANQIYNPRALPGAPSLNLVLSFKKILVLAFSTASGYFVISV